MVILLAGTLALAADCTRQPAPANPVPATSAPPAAEAYTPGLGEIMSLQQMRHVKLWLAGQAKNWELAAYELDELGEGFEDAMKFHPTHKDSPVKLTEVIPKMGIAPVDELRRAVDAKDAAAFVRAYDALTAGCNNCHQSTNFSFNRVQRPAANPYPNQLFEPAGK